jgi:hypothetical protein
VITLRTHHRRACATRSVKNLSMNASGLISDVQVPGQLVDEARRGQLNRQVSCLAIKIMLLSGKGTKPRLLFCIEIGEKSSGASGA